MSQYPGKSLVFPHERAVSKSRIGTAHGALNVIKREPFAGAPYLDGTCHANQTEGMLTW